MKRAAIELLILVALFFTTWFVLSSINWVSIFKVEQVSKTTEEKLGELYWKLFRQTEKEIHSPTVNKAIDSLVTHLCKHNSIDRSQIKLHVLHKEEINAFTLPDNYLVVYTGLIKSSGNEAELLGVLSHEIAHMEKNHVMKKLIKEVGLSVLISMTTGNSSGEVIRNTAKLLSSSAYDRELEREADLAAVDYLIEADIDPEPFANFLYRLSTEEGNLPNQVFWISTHPDSKERAERIIAYLKNKTMTKKSVLSLSSWKNLKDKLEDE
jgi:beta-barrel assembly-enhancing protease